MEPKHKELLDQCHQNLLESITDADRLIELLIVSGTLSQLDRFELDQNCSSSTEKVDHLLKMLVNKESDHFLDLCVALEKAYPDLHATLFGHNGGGPVTHNTGKKFGYLQWPNLKHGSAATTAVTTVTAVTTALVLLHEPLRDEWTVIHSSRNSSIRVRSGLGEQVDMGPG